MRYAPMRFDGLSLRHNPEKLSISEKNHIREYRSPCCEANSRNLGRELRRVVGEGEFCGADCTQQFQALRQRQLFGTRAKLVLPGIPPLYAYLKELEMTAKPSDNLLSYRFVFIEANSPRQAQRESEYYLTISAGESLWDIAYAYKAPIERLVALNPQIPLIDDLREGEKVRLC